MFNRIAFWTAAVLLALIVGCMMMRAAYSATPEPCFLAVFGAEWCPACKAMEADIKALHDAGWAVYRFDVDKDPTTAKRCAVLRADGTAVPLPAIIVIRQRDWWRVWAQSGRIARNDLVAIMRRFGIGRRPK